jgi:hypothetical protein
MSDFRDGYRIAPGRSEETGEPCTDLWSNKYPYADGPSEYVTYSHDDPSQVVAYKSDLLRLEGEVERQNGGR